jgi:tetratricopeptide (TPR) repeat protein
MDDAICEQCGATFHAGASHCPACGSPVQLPVETEDDDPVTLLTHTLLFQARTYQQRGDLANAIQCANDALAIHPTCSTIHTFLGSLYEQQGEKAAARLHFQQALTVTPTPDDDGDMPLLPIPEMDAARTMSGGWMLPVLVGCLVFSGLAALFTLWPGNPTIKHGGPMLYPRVQPKLPFPGPSTKVRTPAQKPTAPAAGKEQQPKVISLPIPRDDSANGTALSSSLNGTGVIGPSATGTLPVLPATPTIEQADEAYAGGAYERAAAIYEIMLTGQDKANPSVQQHLALSYQRLGNTSKAIHHLELAVEGYRQALTADPQNDALRQELRQCQAMLETVSTGGESTTP